METGTTSSAIYGTACYMKGSNISEQGRGRQSLDWTASLSLGYSILVPQMADTRDMPTKSGKTEIFKIPVFPQPHCML